MIEPKTFYRKLDTLLNKIGQTKSGQDYLRTIVNEIEETFRDDLQIINGRIYTRNEDEYTLVTDKENLIYPDVSETLYSRSDEVQAVLKAKTYLYDDPEFSIDSSAGRRGRYCVPVAVTVHSMENRWIIIFELQSGWTREEVEFSLNAVRTALNYRLTEEAIKNEFEQAEHIQQSLLPAEIPDIEGYEVAARSQPAELVGGDLYDFYIYENEEFGFCIGDASGHGIPAALLARDVITGLRMGLEKHMKMVYTLKKLNTVIHKSIYATKFISLFYAEMEPDGNLFYINAGHPAPLLFTSKGVKELESTSLVFGALPDLDLRRSYAKIDNGNILVLYTDGFVERGNGASEEFGLERFIEVIKKNRNKSAREIIDSVYAEAGAFGGKKKWKDDATIVVLKKLK